MIFILNNMKVFLHQYIYFSLKGLYLMVALAQRLANFFKGADGKYFRFFYGPLSWLQLLNSDVVAQKQPQIICEQMCVCIPVNLISRHWNFEFSMIFMSWNIVRLLIFLQPLKNVKRGGLNLACRLYFADTCLAADFSKLRINFYSTLKLRIYCLKPFIDI